MGEHDIVIHPVGVVRNEQKAIVRSQSAGRESRRLRVCEDKESPDAVSRIEIDPDLDGILDGTEGFSHLLVLWWAHQSEALHPRRVKVHPMGRADLPEVGIFATRSPMRPNPILATVVKLERRDGNALEVSGLDAIDGTPVVDVKPVTPGDCPVAELKMPAWLERALSEIDGLETRS